MSSNINYKDKDISNNEDILNKIIKENMKDDNNLINEEEKKKS